MLAIDTETTGVRVQHGCQPFLVAATDERGRSVYWHFPVDPCTREVKVSRTTARKMLETFLKHDRWVFHNAKFDVRALFNIGVDLTPYWDRIDDTLLMSHVCNSAEPHGLKELADKYLHFPTRDLESLKEAVRSARRRAPSTYMLHENVEGDYWLLMDGPDAKLVVEYCLNDTRRTLLLWKLYRQVIEAEGLEKQYQRERRLLPLVYRMEEAGIPLRPVVLNREIDRYYNQAVLEQQACRSTCHLGLNLNSSRQVAHVLYQELNLPVIRHTATGEGSTDYETLRELLKMVEPGSRAERFLKALIAYRKAMKAYQYLVSYQELAIHHDEDRSLRLHPSLNQVGTRTTRFSSSDPNEQNISKQSEIPLRRVFGPRRNCLLISADYDQLELRILAHLSRDWNLCRAFAEGRDIHQETADLCGIDRQQAKTANYAIVYGGGPKTLARLTGVPDMVERFHRAYPGVHRFMQNCIEQARTRGYITTISGYRLYVPQDRLYVAANYAVQGSAGDLLKEAMLEVDQALSGYDTRKGLPRLIMTIHDELVIECFRDQKDVAFQVGEAMQRPGHRYGIETPVDLSLIPVCWSDPKPLKGWKNARNGKHQ